MKWNVGTKIGSGFAIVLTIFVIVGAISYRSVVRQTETARAVTHSYSVENELTQLLSSLQDAETGQRGYLLTGSDSYLVPYTAALPAIDQHRSALASLVADNPEQVAHLDALGPLITQKLGELQQTIELRRTKDFASALALVMTGAGKNTMDSIRGVIGEMRIEEEDTLKIRAAARELDARDTTWTIVAGTLLAALAAAIAGAVVTRDIAGPLKSLTGVAERITIGELSVSANVGERRGDEIGLLGQAFERMGRSLRTLADAAERIAAGDLRAGFQPQSANDQLGNSFVRMTENLRRQIGGMVEAAAVLGSASSQIVASTAQLASGASESAAAVTETTATVEEVRQTAHLTSQKARAVADTAQKSAQIAQGGRKSAADVVAGMERIRVQMEAIAESMVRLSEQSQTIGQIIATVEDLAAQSNLLAVNAAIEAAKAGEQGKGFGVVAQEVKSMAEQSRQATDRVRAILGDIQKATTAAAMATEQGGKAVEAGARHTETAGESIGTLAASVNEAAQAATQIAASSQQQLVGMDQVAVAMENIKVTGTQNMASAKQLENAARNINELGQRLKKLADAYKV
jgi:methyl-accepting chemotaxis protein